MSKKYEWGNATWYLFHIIAEKLTNDIYIVEKSNIINLITTICNNLPCPSSSEHASKYLLTINFNNINSNEDLKMFFFKFHNLVNIRIHKPQFSLDELNKIIADQQGVTVADLALKGPDGETVKAKTETVDPASVYTDEATTEVQDGVVTDEVLAAQYRSQADTLFKEAKALREQAEELVPTKRKAAKKTESAE